MSYEQIKKLISERGYNYVFDVLYKKISDVDFPIYSSVSNNSEVVKMIKKIKKNYEPIIEDNEYDTIMVRKTDLIDFKFNGHYVSMFTDGFEDYDTLITYFSGKCNMHARRYEMTGTPYEIWKRPEHRKKVLRELLNSKQDITIKTLDAINYKIAKACTYFKVTVVINLLTIFKSKKVLDLCAGWGERLLGAIIMNADYTGIDPSECLEPVYKQIIKATKTKNNCIVHKIGAEHLDDAIDKNDMYDTILFAPPYFDLEIYNNDPTQSINVYPTFDEWVQGFLFVSAKLAWEHLEVNGYLVIYISDYKNINGIFSYTERTVLYCCGFLKNCRYEGSIGRTRDRNKYYSFWCFRKDPAYGEGDSEHYRKMYVKNYGDLAKD